MAQSPGDHNSRSPKNYYKIIQEVFPLGKNCLSSSTYVLGACHLPWPSRFSGRYVFGRWWFLWETAGARPCATQTFELFFFDAFFFFYFRLAYSLAPAQKEEVSLRRRLNSALSSRDAWPVPLSHWFPRSDVDPRELGPGQLTQAPEPRANPQGKDNPLSWYRTKIIL